MVAERSELDYRDGMTDIESDIATIIDQESRLTFATFTNDEAIELGMTIVTRARERALPIAVDIRRGGQQLFHAGLEGSAPDNDEWLRRKSNVVQRLHRSSLRVRFESEVRGISLHEIEGVAVADFATHGGSFPIRVKGVGVVGAVTVSGLPDRDDHALVVECIEAFLAAR